MITNHSIALIEFQECVKICVELLCFHVEVIDVQS